MGSNSEICANVAIALSATVGIGLVEYRKKVMFKPLAAMLILNIQLKTIIITYVTY